ncbi:KAP family NTPase [Microbacterium profundi]|uniref:KAP family P-loop NTPase fold protein n=1 Tax=Microbacterium profundi TaxID=450380 RepID=UPI001F42779A|nr:P-loop NTPase fold protein [Microbacterium profundi]MCE7483402.1 KAP family NTPase [Microbacterium profundi]
MNTFARGHWSDEPLEPTVPDSLGRDRFVSTVISRVNLASSTDSSTVFGLVGEWGSGKSSVLAKVRSGLGDEWLVGDFTPWSSGDSGAMAVEFVTTLADVLGEKSSDETRVQLAHYATFATPLLAAIPFLGGAAKGVSENILDAVGKRAPWHRQFQDLSKTIEAIGKKVLIVVDDVDRLGGQELLTLLRIVRLLGRFHGVHYLLAYDQDTVEDLLRSTGSVGRAAAFMEKIVQYPFEIPPIPRAAVGRMLGEILGELVEITRVQFDEVGLIRSSDLVAILSSQIRTPRTLGRFREHLLAFAGHVESAELDILDYAAVTWLRLSAHGIWQRLPDWHQDLRTGESRVSFLKAEKIADAEWIDRISGVQAGESPVETIAVLTFLFPGITFQGNGHYYEHPRGLSNPKYLGRYLLLDIPEDDLSDELVLLATTRLVAGESPDVTSELAEIIDDENEALSELAISKMTEVRRQSITTSSQLLEFLVERVQRRSADSANLSSPLRGLRVLLAREIACAVLSEVANAEEIITLVGEEESLRLVLLAPRSIEFRNRADEILRGFGEYWHAQLIERCDELRKTGKLGLIADLIVHVYSPEEANGLLDAVVSNYETYVLLASSFVRFSEWVGSSINYEMEFRETAFAVLISGGIRQRFAPDIVQEAGAVRYETTDLPTAEASEEVLRAFAVDSVQRLAVRETSSTSAAKSDTARPDE